MKEVIMGLLVRAAEECGLHVREGRNGRITLYGQFKKGEDFIEVSIDYTIDLKGMAIAIAPIYPLSKEDENAIVEECKGNFLCAIQWRIK